MVGITLVLVETGRSGSAPFRRQTGKFRQGAGLGQADLLGGPFSTLQTLWQGSAKLARFGLAANLLEGPMKDEALYYAVWLIIGFGALNLVARASQ